MTDSQCPRCGLNSVNEDGDCQNCGQFVHTLAELEDLGLVARMLGGANIIAYNHLNGIKDQEG